MQPIEPHARALLEHAAAHAPELLPACRWLACGPVLASLMLGDSAREPRAAELTPLIRMLEAAPAEVKAGGYRLLDAHGRFSVAAVGVERLLAAGEDEWRHPTEILGRPCAPFIVLLCGCHVQLRTATGARARRLEGVRQKLDRAVRIETRARHRRMGLTPWPWHRPTHPQPIGGLPSPGWQPRVIPVGHHPTGGHRA